MITLSEGFAAIELRQRRQAVHHRHLDIEHDDLDIVTSERVDRHAAVAHRGDDVNVRIGFERSGEKAADHRAVIDHHDAIRRA